MEEMKTYHLTESAMPQQVAIIFGRFNPPHKGHKHAWETAAGVAPDAWWVGTNQSTVGPDDPLPFDIKLEAMKAIYPEIEGHVITEGTWWTMATHIFKHYGGVPGRVLPFDLIVVTDEPYVVPGLLKSNGAHGEKHGEYHFKDIKLAFDNIEQAKKHLRISSATALRNAVASGDREGFAQAAGVPADMPVAGHPFFDLVAHYLLPHREAQAAKERAKAEKEAAKQNAAMEKERMKAQKAADKAAKVKGPAEELGEGKNPCWKGYKQLGMKKKGGKQVPNCVPTKEGRQRLSQALETIYENRHGSIQDDVARALPSTYVLPGLQNQDAYKQYRFGLAIADVRGRKARANDAGNQSFQAASPWGENEIVVSFDPDIDKVLDAALVSVGQSGSNKKLITTPKSQETTDVKAHSPVANIKRNKYGI